VTPLPHGCRDSMEIRALGALEVIERGGQWQGFVLRNGDLVHWYHAIEAGPQGRRFHYRGTTRVGDPLIPPHPADEDHD
jgi:hypothetical protein